MYDPTEQKCPRSVDPYHEAYDQSWLIVAQRDVAGDMPCTYIKKIAFAYGGLKCSTYVHSMDTWLESVAACPACEFYSRIKCQ